MDNIIYDTNAACIDGIHISLRYNKAANGIQINVWTVPSSL